MRNKFWMAYNRKQLITCDAKEEAVFQAKRLAALSPGERACVLESLYEYTATAPTIETMEHK